MARDDVAVVILAGGDATRLPGKLELDAGGGPLLLRVYRNVAPIGPVYVSANRTFPAALDESLRCPIVIDRSPGHGPLSGLISTFAHVRQARVFVVAGDAPFAGERTAEDLLAVWEAGIDAVVPVDAEGRLQPLCAVYDRAAFLAAASDLVARSGGVAAAVERLRTKRIRLSDERAFANVNTASDRYSLLQR